MKMKSGDLVKQLIKITTAYKTVYMWGVFGAPVTAELIKKKAAQYPDWYTKERQAHLQTHVGKGYFAFDCVNTIKAILWGWHGDAAETYGGAKYATKGVPDIGADGFIKKCTKVSKDFKNAKPGDAVWMPGHIGIYIGGGKAVECTPKWKDGVQITAVGNIGPIKGLETRTWTKIGTNPYIEYPVSPAKKPATKPIK